MSELTFIEIEPEELRAISDRVAVLRDWYNAHPGVVPCQFLGDPCDLLTLGFISYELGESVWDWDHGETLSAVWGGVLVNRFGFHWARLADGPFPGMLAVHNPTLPYTIFSWPRLLEQVSNGGNLHTAAADLLMMVFSDLHARHSIPPGWHPALDALERRSHVIPENIVELLQRLSQREPNWLTLLGLSPFEWNNSVSWENVSFSLSMMIPSRKAR